MAVTLLGSFNRKNEFQKPENLNKAITKGEKFNVAELSLLREFLGNTNAHVILTAEADSLLTDTKNVVCWLKFVNQDESWSSKTKISG